MQGLKLIRVSKGGSGYQHAFDIAQELTRGSFSIDFPNVPSNNDDKNATEGNSIYFKRFRII